VTSSVVSAPSPNEYRGRKANAANVEEDVFARGRGDAKATCVVGGGPLSRDEVDLNARQRASRRITHRSANDALLRQSHEGQFRLPDDPGDVDVAGDERGVRYHSTRGDSQPNRLISGRTAHEKTDAVIDIDLRDRVVDSVCSH
jgi:hypothetical protein